MKMIKYVEEYSLLLITCLYRIPSWLTDKNKLIEKVINLVI